MKVLSTTEAQNQYYLATDISSLNSLQTHCRFVESSSNYRLNNLLKCQISDQGNARATQATYEDKSPTPPTGKVILVEYKNKAEYLQQLSNHVGDTHISDGDAYIQNNTVKIMIFRKGFI